MNQKKAERTMEQEHEFSDLLDLVDVTPAVPKNELILGTLVRLDGSDHDFGVVFPGQPTPVPCLSTVPLDESCINRQVALSFIEGSAVRPIVLGLIMTAPKVQPPPVEVSVDQERLQLVGKKEIELRCGKASILLKANGKIILKGTHLISRSSGPNKIKGASISLN